MLNHNLKKGIIEVIRLFGTGKKASLLEYQCVFVIFESPCVVHTSTIMKFGPVLHSKVVYYYKTIINIGSQFEPVLNQFGIPAKIPNQELNRKPLS